MRRLARIFILLSLVALSAGLNVAVASAPGPSYLAVSSFTAALQNDNSVRLSVTTGADIPRHPDTFINSNPVVGLAWADLDTGKVFVVTIHPVLGRDSHQKPDGWHAHNATLSGGATSPNDFCVASIDASPPAGISLHGDTMSVNVQASKLPVDPEDFDAAVGFTIQPDGGCASGLAVRISS